MKPWWKYVRQMIKEGSCPQKCWKRFVCKWPMPIAQIGLCQIQKLPSQMGSFYQRIICNYEKSFWSHKSIFHTIRMYQVQGITRSNIFHWTTQLNIATTAVCKMQKQNIKKIEAYTYRKTNFSAMLPKANLTF